MEQHFNGKFMESDTYPKAKFSGKVENFDSQTLSDTAQEYVVKGTLSIHGIDKPVESTIYLSKDASGLLKLTSKFSVAVADFDIAVKDKIAKKIAKTVNVEVDLSLE